MPRHFSSFASFQDFVLQVQGSDSLARKMALVDSFMLFAQKSGFPFIEDDLCHFIYRGSVQNAIGVAGDFNGWDYRVDPMSRLASTDFYYCSKTFPLDARLDYKLVRDGQWYLDTLNPHTILGGFGANSELSMPQYVQPAEIEDDPAIPHGRIESFMFTSDSLHNSHKIYVYLPSDYNSQSEQVYPTVYFQDGEEYLQLATTANVLNNLIFARQIPPIIGVFIKPINRNSEYAMNDRFAFLFAQQIVPFIDTHYHTCTKPMNRGVIGDSFGGLISFYLVNRHPGVFGNIAGQSSSIGYSQDALISLYLQSPTVDSIKAYLSCGTFENQLTDYDYVAKNRSFCDLLQSKGYTTLYQEFPEGHSWGQWRAHLDDILVFFWGERITRVR